MNAKYFVRDRVASDVEPLAATKDMPPPLVMGTFRVITEEQIVAPRSIVAIEARASDVCGAAANEFGLIAHATPRTVELHH
jgi:hypothetical protein